MKKLQGVHIISESTNNSKPVLWIIMLITNKLDKS